jgi:hypothetical protein
MQIEVYFNFAWVWVDNVSQERGKKELFVVLGIVYALSGIGVLGFVV